jgi:hypothetical protein
MTRNDRVTPSTLAGSCDNRPANMRREEPETASTGDDAAGSITKMRTLRVIKGDATSPQAKGRKIIAHICNDLGGWGKGFVLTISKRWPEPERAYRHWHRDRAGNDFGLGATQLVQVRPDTWVANMLAQHGRGWPRSCAG